MARSLIGNFKGTKGDTGAKGDKGAKGATGTRGSRWSEGTKITGTSTTATIFSGSGITDALVNDVYLNTSTGNVYRCTVAGAAAAAKWVYAGNIKGPKGDTPTVADNMTVAFTQASTRANIATGEKTSTIMGKIKKWFADMTAAAFAQIITSNTDLMATTVAGYLPDALAVKQQFDSVNSKLIWKRIGSTSVTGTGSVTIPAGASELIIKANLEYNIIIDILIPVAFLDSTEQSYRGGYYQNGSNGGMADFKCTSSKVTFNNAFLNANSVLSTTKWVVYYR